MSILEFAEKFCCIKDEFTCETKNIELTTIQKYLINNLELQHNIINVIENELHGKIYVYTEYGGNILYRCIFEFEKIENDKQVETYTFIFTILFNFVTNYVQIEKRYRLFGEKSIIRISHSFNELQHMSNDILKYIIMHDMNDMFQKSSGYTENLFEYYTNI